jgi:hypothetical protein
MTLVFKKICLLLYNLELYIYSRNTMSYHIQVLIVLIILLLLINSNHFEGFKSTIDRYNRSRSVELYNPSAYTGIFKRKFEVPREYTRTNITYPLYNDLYITKSYNIKNKNGIKSSNIISAPWNIANIYPLVNRRQMII